jgi:protein phosphatase
MAAVDDAPHRRDDPVTGDGGTRLGTGLVVRAGAASDVGRVRHHNEDALVAEHLVFAVADGMGGHAAGEVASAIATATLRELADRSPRRRDDVAEALGLANQRILESVARHPAQAGMGTTAAGLVAVEPDSWVVFNVGDSRVYRLADGELTPLTRDHSEVREMVDAGVITEDEARRHPLRNVVTRSLGSDPAPTPDLWVRPAHAGERFVLCTDGLTNELQDEQLLELVTAHGHPQACADALVAAAVAAGGRDNVSVVVVDVAAADET